MGNLIGELLPLAVGIALSPFPVVAQILMLFGKRARSNGPAFMLGWVLAMMIWGIVMLVVSGSDAIAGGGRPSALSYVIKLVLGLLFLFLAYRSWQSRPKPGEEPKMPAWMSTLDSFSTGKSFGLAALLSATNPKNVGLLASACLLITQSSLSGVLPWVILVVFVLVSCITVIVPVLYYFIAGASAEKTLSGWKAWLVAHNNTIMFVLLLIMGAKLVGDGLGGLIG